MWPAFPVSDYYEGSVPLPSHQRTTLLPFTSASNWREGDSMAVPTFTTHRSTGVGPSFSPAASLWVRRSSFPEPPRRRNSTARELQPSHDESCTHG